MNFPRDAPVTLKKKDALRQRITRLDVDLKQVNEGAVKGHGPGGQKINKSSIGVQLRYAPLALVVTCARERSRAVNRFLALRELVDAIEIRISPETSERLKQHERIRKQKRRRARRAKHASPPPASAIGSADERK